MERSFFVVQDYMVSELKLKGAERDIFAIINGFSQDKESYFYGSLSYLSRMTGYTRRAVIIALENLCKADLVFKYETYENNVKYCKYKINWGVVKKLHHGSEKTSLGVVKKLHWGGEETSPNNKEDNKYDNKKQDIYMDGCACAREDDELTLEAQTVLPLEEQESKYTVEEFAELWNQFARDNQLEGISKLSPERRKKFEDRQKAFSHIEPSPYTARFWEAILYNAKYYEHGAYMGNNRWNEKRSANPSYKLRFDRLIRDDEIIDKFINAVFDGTETEVI